MTVNVWCLAAGGEGESLHFAECFFFFSICKLNSALGLQDSSRLPFHVTAVRGSSTWCLCLYWNTAGCICSCWMCRLRIKFKWTLFPYSAQYKCLHSRCLPLLGQGESWLGVAKGRKKNWSSALNVEMDLLDARKTDIYEGYSESWGEKRC